jgi:hypothetical protein
LSARAAPALQRQYTAPQELARQLQERDREALATERRMLALLSTTGRPFLPETYGAKGKNFDDTSAIQAAINAAQATGIGGEVLFSQPYMVTGQIVVSASNITLRWVGAGSIRVGASWTDGREILCIRGPGFSASANVSADVAAAQNAISLDSTAGLSIGQLFVMESDGEYWNGITGLSGFQPVMKSEMNRVRTVDSSTAITSEWVTEDTYDATSYDVIVKPLRTIKNIRLINARVIGNGQGSAHTSAAWGPIGIGAYFVETFSIERGLVSNCGLAAIECTLCCGVGINCDVIGRDSTDASNVPNISPWFYGLVFTGSSDCTMTGCTTENVRRPVDANYTSGTTIPRNISIAGNVAISCESGFGTHISQHVTMTGNTQKSCAGSMYFRGKDAVLADNIIETYANQPSAAMITIGNGNGTTYAETPNAGRVTITGNKCKGKVLGLYVRCSVDGLHVADNSFIGGNSQGIWISAKSLRNVHIADNTIDSSTRTANRFGVYIENDVAANPMVYAENIVITDNTIVNETEGIKVNGTSRASSTGSITSGAAVLSVDAYTASILRPGLYVRIIGAGAAGVDMVATVSSISGTAVTMSATASTTVSGAAIHWLAPMTGLCIERNRTGGGVAGAINRHINLEEGYFDGERCFLSGNRFLSTATSADIQFDSERFYFSELPVISYEREIVAQSSTSITSKSTVTLGKKIRNTAPTAGGNNQWTNTTPGTHGTITAATTGSIDSGSNQLTLNANSDARVYPGCYITVTGAGVAAANLTARVVEVSGADVTKCTLDTAASTTVAAVAIAYVTPVWKASDAIAA